MPAARGRGRPAHPDVLTPTEWRILDALRHGMRRREIAERRGISINAVKYHARNIAGKLGVETARELRHWPGQPIGTHLPTRTESDMTITPRLGPIGQISLLATDIARAERFYRDTLGLPHLFTFGDLAFFDAGGVRIYIQAKPAQEWRPSSVLYFLVDDIQATVRDLEAKGVAFRGAPHMIHRHADTGVEEWMTFFEDGEGNLLALMAQVPPA
jgi:DNA-binding CsgD family transcriptional regulator/predicted enzyme related to lactoylglutathione lyase